MQYYSTNRISGTVSFKDAAIHGQAPDKGLYFPEIIPQLPANFIKDINSYSKEAVALEVIRPYVGDTIPAPELERMVAETVAFDFPLVPVTDAIATLELFHGPTLAFKDVGARFMSRCLAHFVKEQDQKVTVLVATSGDTGGAVAHGFYGVEGVDVVILYPSGKVSRLQELQLTTLGKNITALEVAGSFDDCQHLVKQAFADTDLKNQLFLTSANSINVARWLPQQFYYFFAYQQWPHKEQPPVICVPSGNFGNICAGLLAYCSGLPVQHFISACNANDIVPQYLQTGTYAPKEVVATLSNAMDVAQPSNFVRIMELFDQELGSLQKILSGHSVSDEVTKGTIRQVYEQYHYLLDPHGAVGYAALQAYVTLHPKQRGFFLETAHPVKFYDAIEPIIQHPIEWPASVKSLAGATKKSITLEVNYEELKTYLMTTVG